MKDKKTIFVFHGPFRDYCPKYAEYKKSQGFAFGKRMMQMLKSMDSHFEKYIIETPCLTKEMVEEYAAKRGNESPITQNKRITQIRQFAIFMNHMGFDFYVYPMKLIKMSNTFTPYIFTHYEIKKIYDVIDHLEISPYIKNYNLIYPMMFRMLYGCGLRINEALSLKREHVDLENGVLILTHAKNNTSRLVPMSESLTKYCILYMKKMGRTITQNGYYFPSRDGGRYSHTPVFLKLKKFMSEAGIRTDSGRIPRVHDIRHSFSVHTLDLMTANGWDAYCSLPVLSTYLGHSDIKSTEKYLRLTEESFNTVTSALSLSHTGVFPEVCYEKK